MTATSGRFVGPRIFLATRSAGVRVVVSVGALLLTGACTEGTAPTTSTPAPTYGPTPAIGSFHVVLTTTGANADPDGYQLVIDDSIARPVRANDTVLVTKVVLDRHTLRLDGVATNCVVDSGTARSLVLTSTRDTVARFTIDCVASSVPPELAGAQMLFVRAGQIHRATIGDVAASVELGAGDEPVWSPDGQRIAFVRGGDVYVMDATGANVRLIATGPPPETWPPVQNGFAPLVLDADRHAVAWSPDGSRLALYSATAIVIAPVDGAAPMHLDGGGSLYGELPGSPAWSPDGKRVAFVSGSWGDWNASELLDVLVGDVNGAGLANVRRLTDATSSDTIYAQPAWSPDGSRIALVACARPVDYVHPPCAGSRIITMNADGSQPRTLAFAGGLARPAWSPDGQVIAFANTCWDHACPSGVLYVSVDGARKGMLLDDAYAPALHR